jgi:hypothetical protein
MWTSYVRDVDEIIWNNSSKREVYIRLTTLVVFPFLFWLDMHTQDHQMVPHAWLTLHPWALWGGGGKGGRKEREEEESWRKRKGGGRGKGD